MVRSSVDSPVLVDNPLEVSSVVDRLVAHKADNSLADKVAAKLLVDRVTVDSLLVVSLITMGKADKWGDRTTSSLVAPTPTSKHFT